MNVKIQRITKSVKILEKTIQILIMLSDILKKGNTEFGLAAQEDDEAFSLGKYYAIRSRSNFGDKIDTC